MPLLRRACHELSWAMFVVWRRVRQKILSIKRIFIRPKLPRNPDGKVCIHLGCGEIASPEFINVDVCSAPHIHFVREVSDLSVFPDRYADLVYACHLLEHIDPKRLHHVLWEWRRVLKVGGTLRIAVPDFDKLIHVYEACGRDVESVKGPMLGAWGSYTAHGMIFNHKYLEKILSEAGFTSIHEWDPAEVEHHEFEDWASRPMDRNGSRFEISLNVEGVRAT